ncbi:hypothetical protein TW85_06325 [Marinomonas sp. S3726]|uniref:hypothetical protein n=1 Tax=Marinomonas sp. S3726 TaxID=579484 RepID=UPI0005FA20AF|nr:hypothetical protein [Marinomonas sp. S3726]KJZ15197.1 hypothetical protein TW85_06325 [Marinomonas sp. S3726]
MIEITRGNLLKKVAIAALAYTFIEAFIAGIGRRLILSDFYANSNYFDTVEPSLGAFVYGMSIHLMTGVLVSILYARLWIAGGKERPASPRNYSVLMFLLHWVLVVYGYLGKHFINNIAAFLSLEALFVALTFVFYSLVLKKVFQV